MIQQSNNETSMCTVGLTNDFRECSRMDLIVLISRVLSFFIEMNETEAKAKLKDNKRKSPIFLTRFHSKVPPSISVFDYLIRLTKYSSLEPCVLLTAVYYIDLLTSVYPDFNLNSLTVHRYLITATTVASKGLCDSFCTNSHYAKVGGIRTQELNVLESDFLERVRYRVIPRQNNIKLCQLEYQTNQDIQVYHDPDIQKQIDDLSNSNYSVLDMYYKKIVNLVGNCSVIKESFQNTNYSFKIDPKDDFSTEALSNNNPEIENNSNSRKRKSSSVQSIDDFIGVKELKKVNSWDNNKKRAT